MDSGESYSGGGCPMTKVLIVVGAALLLKYVVQTLLGTK